MELPVIDFIQTSLQEADSDFEIRVGTAYYDLFVKPQELMLQPLVDTMALKRIGQSIRLIRALDDPNSFDETQVDNNVSNVYVTRDPGALSTATVRVYYAEPIAKEYAAGTAEFQSGSLSFFNINDISITADQMALQSDGTLYYLDTVVQGETQGDVYNVAAGLITVALNDSDAVRVTNLAAAQSGLARETNIELMDRAQNSIGVRDLETVKGINAILRDKFPFISEIQPIGLGDPEMMRDVLFNVHVGGKTDVYLKTPSLTDGFTDVIGLDYDTTREISRNLHLQMAKSDTDSALPADVKTPQIVVGTVVVKEDLVESSATITSVSIAPGTGIDLSATPWLRIQIDATSVVQVKVSGASPTQTQRFEIINSINAAVGFTVATPATNNRFALSSLIVGQGSQIVFYALGSPQAPSQNAALALFGIALNTLPQVLSGAVATTYIEDTDYSVGYEDGLISQMPFTTQQRDTNGTGRQTITSGQYMLTAAVDGLISLVNGNYYFDSHTDGKFNSPPLVLVRSGDEVTINAINGTTSNTVIGNLPATFIVSQVISSSRLELSDFFPSGVSTGVVNYSIKSNQVVDISYNYHPISVDIGPLVLLADGSNRGVRPGRSDFTIKDVPFIDITSIQEIDPETSELIGTTLTPPAGFGAGGFGLGGYGVGNSGDYMYFVNSPTDRFSCFEDAVILFSPDAITRSFRISYRYVPEIVAIHNLSRNDEERVTGADVLPKNFVPGLVDITIGIRRDATNLTTPADADLAVLVQALVNTTKATDGLKASDIIKLLEAQGVDSVQTPFTMKATILNTDGSTSILESQDILLFEDSVLPKITDNFVTQRIVHFYPNDITVVEVT